MCIGSIEGIRSAIQPVAICYPMLICNQMELETLVKDINPKSGLTYSLLMSAGQVGLHSPFYLGGKQSKVRNNQSWSPWRSGNVKQREV